MDPLSLGIMGVALTAAGGYTVGFAWPIERTRARLLIALGIVIITLGSSFVLALVIMAQGG